MVLRPYLAMSSSVVVLRWNMKYQSACLFSLVAWQELINCNLGMTEVLILAVAYWWRKIFGRLVHVLS